MRMNETNVHHMCVWCVHITNDKRESKTKFEMKSINFIRKRAVKGKGARKGERGKTSTWGDRTGEAKFFFYHFWTRNRRQLEWTANKANTEKRRKLIRDVRRIEFWIPFLTLGQSDLSSWQDFKTVFEWHFSRWITARVNDQNVKTSM